MKVARTYEVAQTGIGKPDYTKEVSAGRQRAGISLKHNQQLVTFGPTWTDMIAHPSPIPWVKPPLAAAGQSHLIDFATGLAMPYGTLVGYSITVVQKDWTCSEDIEIWLYYDGILIACPGISNNGDNVYINPVWTYTSTTLDPAAAAAHAWDVLVVNRGAGDLEGGIVVATIVEAVGTPPFPNTKQCGCPFCHHRQTVPVGTTVIVCENCGKKYFVHDFSKVRII